MILLWRSALFPPLESPLTAQMFCRAALGMLGSCAVRFKASTSALAGPSPPGSISPARKELRSSKSCTGRWHKMWGVCWLGEHVVCRGCKGLRSCSDVVSKPATRRIDVSVGVPTSRVTGCVACLSLFLSLSLTHTQKFRTLTLNRAPRLVDLLSRSHHEGGRHGQNKEALASLENTADQSQRQIYALQG